MANVILSHDCDVPLLYFLWLWKVSTTAALSEKFYGSRTPMRAYMRLRKLHKADFIQCRVDSGGGKYFWSLTKKGYQKIRGFLPHALKQDGYKSEYVGHDLFVAAVHLGEWLKATPPGCALFTEQQLRRFPLELYPE